MVPSKAVPHLFAKGVQAGDIRSAEVRCVAYSLTPTSAAAAASFPSLVPSRQTVAGGRGVVGGAMYKQCLSGFVHLSVTVGCDSRNFEGGLHAVEKS